MNRERWGEPDTIRYIMTRISHYTMLNRNNISLGLLLIATLPLLAHTATCKRVGKFITTQIHMFIKELTSKRLNLWWGKAVCIVMHSRMGVLFA